MKLQQSETRQTSSEHLPRSLSSRSSLVAETRENRAWQTSQDFIRYIPELGRIEIDRMACVFRDDLEASYGIHPVHFRNSDFSILTQAHSLLWRRPNRFGNASRPRWPRCSRAPNRDSLRSSHDSVHGSF